MVLRGLWRQLGRFERDGQAQDADGHAKLCACRAFAHDGACIRVEMGEVQRRQLGARADWLRPLLSAKVGAAPLLADERAGGGGLREALSERGERRRRVGHGPAALRLWRQPVPHLVHDRRRRRRRAADAAQAAPPLLVVPAQGRGRVLRGQVPVRRVRQPVGALRRDGRRPRRDGLLERRPGQLRPQRSGARLQRAAACAPLVGGHAHGHDSTQRDQAHAQPLS
mmetsp:Transcript_52303/g.113994  ORF Transcript_52303/g.113994 Transcript_52303/m.113994 type:complete len:225 (-) Transcript_52303:481-1155(-)